MMPFFTLNYLTNSSFTKQNNRLKFVERLTKKGRNINKAFNSKLFLVLLNMIEPDRIRSDTMTGLNNYI